MKELEQKVNEEIQRWQVLHMPPPRGVPEGINAPGIPVSLFEMETRLQALVKILIEKEIISLEEADEVYQQTLLDRLTAIREAFEARRKAELIVARQRLLGPDGKPMANGGSN